MRIDNMVPPREKLPAIPPQATPGYKPNNDPWDFNREAVQIGGLYFATDNMDYLEASITSLSEAIALVSKDDPNRAVYFHNFGVMLMHRYEQEGGIADLDGAIQAVQEAIALTPKDNQNQAAYLDSFGDILMQRYKQTANTTDLMESIRVAQQAVQLTPDNDPDLARRLNGLRSKQTRYIESVEEAIRVARQAVEITPENDPGSLTETLDSLGSKLIQRYHLLGTVQDLEEAIQVTQRALELIRDDSLLIARLLFRLGSLLSLRYGLSRKKDDLEKAIYVMKRAVELTPNDDPRLAGRLDNLGSQLESQYEQTGNIVDLEEAIRVARQAVELTPDDDPSLPSRLDNLGNRIEHQYKQTRNKADLEEAIRVAKQAVELTPDNDPRGLASKLNNLGNKLESQYEQTGNIVDLEEAIRVARQAIENTPNNDSGGLAGRMNNLGSKLERQYKQTGNKDDLEEAIQLARRAVELTPANDLGGLVGRLDDLGSKLESRYKRTGNIVDLEEAIRATRQAVNLTPEEHWDLADSSFNLASMLSRRYEVSSNMDDLKETIRVALRAAELTPDNHQALVNFIINLGSILGRQNGQSRQTSGLEEAIQVARRAVELTPGDNRAFVGLLRNLGSMLSSQYDSSGRAEEPREVVRVTQHTVETAVVDSTTYDAPKRESVGTPVRDTQPSLDEIDLKIVDNKDLEEGAKESLQSFSVKPEIVFDSARVMAQDDSGTKAEEADNWLRGAECMMNADRFLDRYRKLGNDGKWDLRVKDMVKIGILDTGIDLGHPEFEPFIKRGQILDRNCKDFVNLETAGKVSVRDNNGHGTHCAHAILKICKTARLYIGKVFETGLGDEKSAERVVEGINWLVEQNVDIISMSLAFKDEQPNIERAIKKAIGHHDILFFAAASNNNHYIKHPVGFPATLDTVIRVNSCTHTGERSHFSPKSDYKRDNALSTIGEEIEAAYSNEKDGIRTYKRLSGTSTATAIMVGCAGLAIEFTKIGGLGKNGVAMEQELHKSRKMKAVLYWAMNEEMPHEPPTYTYVRPWLLFNGEQQHEDVVISIKEALRKKI